ncbi:protein-disulfide reductase DsbD family protein [Mucilaginibacter auburnensis]|uniref:Thiol:disulfide interchange protein DsbD n=1 Tax=Mucilaginibacter auburnensis TaxID=1457233 RepID=A0A2H9VQR1_9SPHI|nr:thioredoxin family protein [Mucilaginibacter auburnensis]PJJ83150.1 thiol:disulfide interchange protein DsbD [Mucilaginibacter auburnensis]
MFNIKVLLTKTVALLAFVLLLCLASAGEAKAQEPDTSGMVFTEITTTADSLADASKKDTQQVVKATQPVVASASAAKAPQSLWAIFLAGFVAGFAAFLMPCIYPMLPLTVSFFTKKAGSRTKGIFNSMLYGLSIIFIYVFIGILIAVIFGPTALNDLATNGIFNFLFFLLLIAFGVSFLGAFEITLPSSLANKLDENSDKGGLAGIFFMAATLVVVSFSCTGPLVGSVLIDAALKGERLGPAISMLGFSTALALPFTLFAMFPSALNSLPKSGGWLNSVKVILGFIEIAFALKFLSNVDLAYHWNIIDREVVLSIWIAISLLAGLYLIGKIRFAHDSPVEHLSVPRTFIAIGVFAFTVYLIPGMWGAPLKSISALLPPLSTQDFDISAGTAPVQSVSNSVSIKEKKYEELFRRLPKVKGIDEWYDFEQAKAVAREVKKPIMIDFTGWNCVNCRQMEQNVFPDAEVLKRLQNEFVMVQLVIDDKTALPEAEQFTSAVTKKRITTLGGKWLDFEIGTYNSNAQPFYVIVDENGQTLVPPQGAIFDIPEFIKYLDSGISAYKTLQAAKK